MNIILLENVILKDDELEYDKQNVLEITICGKTIYYDIIDKRINDYKVIVTDESKVTKIAHIDFNIYEEVIKSEIDIIQEHFEKYGNINLSDEDKNEIASEIMSGDRIVAICQDEIFKKLEQYL